MSMTQRRLQLNRQRAVGVWGCVIGAAFTVGVAYLLSTDPTRVLTWLMLVVGLAGIGSGVGRLQTYVRARRAFEAEHGIEAGQQDGSAALVGDI